MKLLVYYGIWCSVSLYSPCDKCLIVVLCMCVSVLSYTMYQGLLIRLSGALP